MIRKFLSSAVSTVSEGPVTLIVELAVLIASLSGARTAQAQTLTVLHSFCSSSNCTDGIYPYAGLVRDSAGNLYGTTNQGGSSLWCLNGCGVAFKIDTTGKETVLHSFSGGSDGANPGYGYLLRDNAGNLYGTTYEGGREGNGTAFRIGATGKELLLPFTGGSDGGFPLAGLISDSAGNFYGTTQARGTECLPYGCGTVFEITKAGKEKALYSFAGYPDGYNPQAELVRDSAGNLYGTVPFGGTSFGGIAFKIDPSGKETVLYNFCSFSGCLDGANPYAGLVMDSAGNLYGTTNGGGDYYNGTVFKIDTSGNETILYSFGGVEGDGGFPMAGLVMDSDGNLYGTTESGGSAAYGSGCGTIFRIDSTGNETNLYNFCSLPNQADGAGPQAGLVLDNAGNLYGTTTYGGTSLSGTAFKLALQ